MDDRLSTTYISEINMKYLSLSRLVATATIILMLVACADEEDIYILNCITPESCIPQSDVGGILEIGVAEDASVDDTAVTDVNDDVFDTSDSLDASVIDTADIMDVDAPDIVSSSTASEVFFTVNLPIDEMTVAEWNERRPTYQTFIDLGVKPLVTIDNRNPPIDRVTARVQELGSNVAFLLRRFTCADYEITRNAGKRLCSDLDILNFGTNNVLHSSGIPSQYFENLSSNTCTNYNQFVDPAYIGALWSEVLNIYTERSNLISQNRWSNTIVVGLGTFNDLDAMRCVAADGFIATNLLDSSSVRYPGATYEERRRQHEDNWRTRGREIEFAVGVTNTILSGDNEEREDARRLTWPAGTAENPASLSFVYYSTSDDINKAQEKLDLYDYSNSYVYLTFGSYLGSPGRRLRDPKVIQKLGYLFNQEQVRGVILEPGPFRIFFHCAAEWQVDREIRYYQQLLEALIRGLNGTDIELDAEVCGDGKDNDGDGAFDCYDPDCPCTCTCQDEQGATVTTENACAISNTRSEIIFGPNCLSTCSPLKYGQF